jgi:hypothetical protein
MNEQAKRKSFSQRMRTVPRRGDCGLFVNSPPREQSLARGLWTVRQRISKEDVSQVQDEGKRETVRVRQDVYGKKITLLLKSTSVRDSAPRAQRPGRLLEHAALTNAPHARRLEERVKSEERSRGFRGAERWLDRHYDVRLAPLIRKTLLLRALAVGKEGTILFQHLVVAPRREGQKVDSLLIAVGEE